MRSLLTPAHHGSGGYRTEPDRRRHFSYRLRGAAFANKRRKMDRSFVIVQISDLHLDGSGRLLATIETLNAAIRERMADFADVPDRILLITGDIVDDPAPPALDEAIAVIASFRQTGLFTDIQAIAGNHDVKRPSQRAGATTSMITCICRGPRRASTTVRPVSIWCCWIRTARASRRSRAATSTRAPITPWSRIPRGLASNSRAASGRAAAPIMPSRLKTWCACWRCTIIHCRRRPEKESVFSACPTSR